MAKLLFIGTHGSDDPTRAALPLVSAAGALEAGHEPEVALLGEGAYLLTGKVADEVHAVAFGNVGERLRDLADRGVPFHL